MDLPPQGKDGGMYIHVAVMLILFMGNAVYWGVGYGID